MRYRRTPLALLCAATLLAGCASEGIPVSVAFDPIARFRHWSRWQHARFNWLAGDALRLLGYEPQATPADATEQAWNRLLDLVYGPAHRLRGVWRSRAARRRSAAR